MNWTRTATDPPPVGQSVITLSYVDGAWHIDNVQLGSDGGWYDADAQPSRAQWKHDYWIEMPELPEAP